MSDISEEIRRQYAYFQLVKDGKRGNDLVGMIAYSLYKKQKVEYIIDFKRRKGKKPTEEELLEYQRQHCTETGVESLRSSADNLLAGFATFIIEDKRGDLVIKEKQFDQKEKRIIEKEKELSEMATELNRRKIAQDKKDKDLKTMSKICPKRGSLFWGGFFQNIFATLVMMIITIIILLYSSIPNDIIEMIIKKAREIK